MGSRGDNALESGEGLSRNSSPLSAALFDITQRILGPSLAHTMCIKKIFNSPGVKNCPAVNPVAAQEE
jgi:hypothetical protein